MVDDHMIFREGVSSLINLEKDMKVAGAVGSLAEMKAIVKNISPDIILMDLSILGFK